MSLAAHARGSDSDSPAEYLRLPCGTCLGCRLSRARGWAIRCQLEADRHSELCWTTLTYDDERLPPTLRRSDLQFHLRSLRKKMRGQKVRFFAAGEYGERTYRPHYHAIMFGAGQEAPIQECWPFGFARVDPLSPAAIAYVAGYASKKLDYAREPEDRIDYSTGEVFRWQPPFIQMSRRPGIGGDAREFWRSWRHSAIWDGSEVPVPRYLHEAWKAHVTDADITALQVEREGLPHYADRDSLAAAEVTAFAKHDLTSEKRYL